MKECEIFSNLKVPCGSKMVVRIDGRHFSKLSDDLGLKKPYDLQFVEKMIDVSGEFFQEFNPDFIYTLSDEINILLSEVPFGGRIEKIDSVFASFIGSAFTRTILEEISIYRVSDKDDVLSKPPSFDSRIIPLSKKDIVEYFRMRQNEAWRNCINGYAYWTLREEYDKYESSKILKGKKSNELHDLLFERGINIAEVPTWQRRGVGIYKKLIQVEGYNPLTKKNVISQRRKIFVDWHLPIFDGDFFSDNLIF
jgi:tRNA(His) guanylyltransferase